MLLHAMHKKMPESCREKCGEAHQMVCSRRCFQMSLQQGLHTLSIVCVVLSSEPKQVKARCGLSLAALGSVESSCHRRIRAQRTLLLAHASDTSVQAWLFQWELFGPLSELQRRLQLLCIVCDELRTPSSERAGQ
jgi:hypothetical protein